MSKKIDAKLKKQIQRAIKANQLEVRKADDLMRQLKELRRQFQGFQKLESLVTKTGDHENSLNDAQAGVRISIEKFEACKTRDEALRELMEAPNIKNYEELQRGNQNVLREWKHIKKSWMEDKKLLKAIEKSRKKGFTGELTFFR